MAYIETDDTNPDELKKTQAAASAPTDDSALSTSGSGIVTGSSSAGDMSQAQGEKPTDPSQSGWQNLDAYLNANSDQADQMGQQVASGVTNQVQNAKSSLDDLSNNFNNQANAATTSLDAQKSLIDQAASDPTAYANDPTKFGQIKNDLSGAYSGPNSIQDLSDYQKVTANFNNAQSAASLTANEAGRDQLLKNTYARPDYNQGEANLDQLLLANNPNSQIAISNANAQWAGLTGAIGAATSQSQSLAAQAAAKAKETSVYANQTISSAQKAAQDAITQRVSDETGKEQATNTHYDELARALANKELTAGQAQELGLPTNDFYAYNTNLGSFLSGHNDQIANISNVATADDQAKISALNSLLGTTGGSYFDPNQLGTFKQNQIAFDAGAAGNAIRDKQGWDNMLKTTNAKSLGFNASPTYSLQDLITLFKTSSVGGGISTPVLKADGNLSDPALAFAKNNPDSAAAKEWLKLVPYSTGANSVVKVNNENVLNRSKPGVK